MASLIGKQIGNYRITERIGRGGMADVYLGIHTHLDRKVAIKVLHGHLLEDEDFIERFKREAKSVANLRHPNIVQVHDFDIEDDIIFMVMEYIDGINLQKQLVDLGREGERLPIKQIGSIINDIANALDYAHSQGMLHRDVKPSNILIDQEGKAYLTDFGIARILSDQRLTATGTLIGTPAYMSPEQGRGEELTEESDIYSLGIVAFELLTGQVPFDAKTPIGIVHKQINDPVPILSDLVDGVPLTAQEVLNRALAKNPQSRFNKAEELVAALRTALAALESTEPLAKASVSVDRETLDAPTVAMQDPKLGKATVVMEKAAQKEKQPPKAAPEKGKKSAPPPRAKQEKKKLPAWAYIVGGVVLLGGIGVVLTQILDLSLPGQNPTDIWDGPETIREVRVVYLPSEEASLSTGDEAGVNQSSLDISDGENAFIQAQQHFDNGSFSKAIDASLHALGAGYETYEVYHLIGKSFHMLGDCSQALGFLNTALEMQPDYYWSLYHRGCCQLELGNLDEAIQDLERATSVDPGTGAAWSKLAEAFYYYSGNEQYFDDALTAANQAIDLDPNDYSSRAVRGEIRWNVNNDIDGALEDINIAVGIAPPDDPRAFNIRGLIYLRSRQYDLCVSDYNEVIARDPGNPWVWLERGDCFVGLNDVNNARSDYLEFLTIIEGNQGFNDERSRVENWLNSH